MELNHCAFRVYRDDFEMVVSLFTEKLGFRVLRRKGSVIWMRQGELPVDIQLSASDTEPETKGLDIDALRSVQPSIEDALANFDVVGFSLRVPWNAVDESDLVDREVLFELCVL